MTSETIEIIESTPGALVEVTSEKTIFESEKVIQIVDAGLQGPQGPQGPKGETGEITKSDAYKMISDNPNNRLTTGSDAGLMVPEIGIDPLAYYILSKS